MEEYDFKYPKALDSLEIIAKDVGLNLSFDGEESTWATYLLSWVDWRITMCHPDDMYGACILLWHNDLIKEKYEIAYTKKLDAPKRRLKKIIQEIHSRFNAP